LWGKQIYYDIDNAFHTALQIVFRNSLIREGENNNYCPSKSQGLVDLDLTGIPAITGPWVFGS
jgi:hypothetical protein